jgi:hypothetical protein
MMIDTANIVGANEIADRLQRAHSTIVHQWRMRNIGFPEPCLVLSAGLFWEWDKVEAWFNGRMNKTKKETA